MKTKNLQPDQKIFFLGLNKNATTSFYRFFQKNGYKCEDSATWWCYHTKEEFKDNEVFTDGYEKKFRGGTDPKFDCWPNIHFLNETFPNSYYILQTRPMKDWLLSRQLKYAANRDKNKKIDLNRTLYNIEEDYILRLYWHKKINWEANVLFKETSKQFLELDISKQNSNLITMLENFLEIKFQDKLLIEQNKTTWIDEETLKFYENKVIEFLQQKKYEI